MPFFLLAYFMSVILADLNVTMVTWAILGTLIAVIFVYARSGDGSSGRGGGSGDPLDDGFDDGYVEEYDDGF